MQQFHTLTPSPIEPSPALNIGLTLVALAVVLCLLIIIESAVMQLLSWGALRRSLKGAAWMNAVSAPVNLIFLILTPALMLWGLFGAWLLSVIVESIVLMRLLPEKRGYNIFVALIANLVSYVILLLPAFWYARG